MTGYESEPSLEKSLSTRNLKHTKNLKAFLTKNVFSGLTHDNDKRKTKIKHPAPHTVPNDTVTSVLGFIMKNSIENGGCMKKAFTLSEDATHVANCNNMRKSAFTLAEILITLGIIGIVAAMTMPTLIQKHKKQEATARLKKFVSTMEQAIMLSESENGTKAYQWVTRSNDFKDEILQNPQLTYDQTYSYWNKYLAPYVKSVKVEKGKYIPKEDDEEVSKSTSTTIYLADGSMIIMHWGNCIDLIYDINGDKLPNEQGKDRFRFFMPTTYTYSAENVSEIAKNKSFAPAYMPILTTREIALNYCKNQGANYCTAVLQYDNWEFKDDYPHKL